MLKKWRHREVRWLDWGDTGIQGQIRSSDSWRCSLLGSGVPSESKSRDFLISRHSLYPVLKVHTIGFAPLCICWFLEDLWQNLIPSSRFKYYGLCKETSLDPQVELILPSLYFEQVSDLTLGTQLDWNWPWTLWSKEQYLCAPTYSDRCTLIVCWINPNNSTSNHDLI